MAVDPDCKKPLNDGDEKSLAKEATRTIDRWRDAMMPDDGAVHVSASFHDARTLSS